MGLTNGGALGESMDAIPEAVSMLCRVAISLVGLFAISSAHAAADDGTVSTYLRNGWDIKAVSQVSSTGRTQVILQKGHDGVVCTIYFSVVDKGWVPQGCDPLP